MYRRFFLPVIIALMLAACAQEDSQGTYADRMSEEHESETPVASAATQGADTLQVDAMDVVYASVGEEDVTGYLAKPRDADGSLPGIIVIQEWWGLNDNIRAMARKLAAEGYAALAVDLYGGQVAQNSEDARAYMMEAMENEEAALSNLQQAYAYLSDEQGASSVGSIGWCFGGGWSLRTALALSGDLDAAIMYYGRVITDTEQLNPLRTPLLGFFGGQDEGIPVENVRAFEEQLESLGKQAEIHIYDDANHAFANPSGQSYNAEAAEDSWTRTLEFFDEHLN